MNDVVKTKTDKKNAEFTELHPADRDAKDRVVKMMKELEVEFVDLRFTDLRGKEHHVTLPQNKIDDNFFIYGKAFDGSSLCGWQHINESDLLLIPDASTAIMDIFCEVPTLIIRCDVYDPMTQTPYILDPRGVAIRAEEYLAKSGIADVCNFGQEVEFFVFDDVRWDIKMNGCFYQVDSQEASWNSAAVMEGGNLGHRPRSKGGYFPVPPVDSSHDLRSAMCKALMVMGL